MKSLLLSVLLIFSITLRSQNMTEEEKAIRDQADYTSFLKAVKNSGTTGCLCNGNEYVIFSFRTKSNKTASLCVSKKVSKTSGYLVYRFGIKGRIELSFPADTLNSFSQFSFAHYNRGGGKQNAAMYVNSLHFTNGDYTYTLHDDWNSEDDHYYKGVTITNNKTGKTTSIDARGKAMSSLSAFSNGNVVKETDEL